MTLWRVRRLYYTIRYLRFKQILYRIYYRLHRPTLSAPEVMEVRKWDKAWASPRWQTTCLTESREFLFLGEKGRVDVPGDWNKREKSKLWLYNLHYLDELNSINIDDGNDSCSWLVDKWINENPPLQGNGWEPYPLSLRLVNLVKWFSCQTDVTPKWISSLAQQGQALYIRPEYHILGNHLFANGKALVFVGSYLNGKQAEAWFYKGLKILDREIKEQFFPDGGHFELSPMYHSTLLWDMCDLIALADCSALPELTARASQWKGIVSRGLKWLSAMIHPDQEISFFNDSTLKIAPRFHDLKVYAQFLCCSFPEAKNKENFGVHHLINSGYCVVDIGHDSKAILDVGHVGPEYQPGHAHADTLSFELSLFKQRLFVNSGISQYGEGAERQYQRSTCAHNTVIVDGEDSSEVWAGFRVARRACPQGFRLEKTAEQVEVSCSHNGYRRLPGKNIHFRKWTFQKESLIILDKVSGGGKLAEARFYLHPDVSIDEVVKGVFSVYLTCGAVVTVRIVNAVDILLADTVWHPQFGASIPNKCIIAKFCFNEIQTFIEW